MFESEYKRRRHLCNMQRYLEMGYDEESASAAVERHGDDLHAGCHWLMMRDTLGQRPKRLRRRAQEETYIGSTIMYQGSNQTVDGYDSRHALIRVRDTDGSRQWAHMSDQRIDWVALRHDALEPKCPVAAWRRRVGHVDVDLTGLSADTRTRLTQLNCLELYVREGRPSLTATYDVYTKRLRLWRTIVQLLKGIVHAPSGPKPLVGTTADVHAFRVEWMTYFHSVCEVHHVGYERFSSDLFAEPTERVVQLFPADVREQLAVHIQHWRNPRPHLRRVFDQWKTNCLPLLEFVCEDIQGDTATLGVILHDMSFVRPTNCNGSMHTHLQRIFKYMYGKTGDDAGIQGPMDSRFFRHILRMSRKSHRRQPLNADALVTPLLSYQQKCLAWMLHRESAARPISSWGWSKHELQDGFSFYTSAFGHMTLTEPNQSIRGGLLAQDVGMGKTVEMLALMASGARRSPTLVVVPTTMLAIWMEEAAKHVPSFKTMCFHGARRTRDMDVLRNQDLVITTYRICVNETQRHVPTLGAIRWGRVVLDESHELRNPMSATVKAVCRLYAPYRWCISATPFTRGVMSAASMLAFFGVAPFKDMPTTQLGSGLSASQHLLRNSSTNSDMPTLMTRLMLNLTLWEQKRHVRMGLPEMTFEVIQLAHTSMPLYERLRQMVVNRLQEHRDRGDVNLRTRTLHYTRWLQQAATEPRLLTESLFGQWAANNHARVEKTSVQAFINTLGDTDYDNSLRDTMASIGDQTCAICMDAMDRPTVTPCQHLFCYECIQSAYEHDLARKCPLCRTPAGTDGLHELTLQDQRSEGSDDQTWRVFDYMGREVSLPMDIHRQYIQPSPSHKIEAMLTRLRASEDKWVVFTQYHTCWKYICEQLHAHGIRFTCIEGRMTPGRRAKAVRDFQDDDDVRVFVLTTKTAAVGLTLTAARHVLFMEPCTDASLRKQAIGRIRRIGQTHAVTVHTFQTKGTIECVKSQHINRHLTEP